MKTWALILVFAASTIVPVKNAEAKDASKTKVVVISFDEKELKESAQAPLTEDERKEADAEARHMARLAEANISIPEF